MIHSSSRFIPLTIFALTLVWYTALVLTAPTHGVIGDDPATYVQMALSLAQSGTVTREFSLLSQFYDKGLSWDAFITPGYHIVRETGALAPNFGVGFPVLLALGYRLLGESALYGATPLMGGLALVATFALGNELWRTLSPARRYWLGALAALLLATTPKQIQLALVPMSDVPTQLFCVLGVWCAVRLARPNNAPLPGDLSFRAERGISTGGSGDLSSRAQREISSLLLAALCGIFFGVAYLMRQSAFVLVVPLAIAAVRWGHSRRERIVMILASLFAFGLVLVPDFVYRANVLGSPFAPSSPESTQLVLLEASRQVLDMVTALFSVTGMGPVLIVSLALGFGLADRENRFAGLVLGAWVLAFVLIHAPLRLTGVFENSLRYLVPAYPAIALLIGRGMVLLFDWGRRAVRDFRGADSSSFSLKRGAAPIAVLVAVILFVLAIRAVVSPERFVARAYGWMSATARGDLTALDAQLPPNAVIGTSDQMAGAAILYTGREIFRPASFVEPRREFPQFLAELKAQGRAVYLLGDWECAPLAGASEKLPEWLAAYNWESVGLEIRELPYECAQKVREVK